MKGKVYYGKGYKALSVMMGLFALFVTYAASQATEDQKIIAALVALFFVLGSAFLIYQAFFVYFSYDDTCLYFSKKQRRVFWINLIEMGYMEFLDMNYLRFEDFGRIWISPYMQGIDALTAFLETKTKEIDATNQ